MLFFALSGFLMWRPFVAGRPALARYAIHRAARILPAWWLACLVLVPLLGGALGPYLVMQPDRPAPLGIVWTLQAEVAFYFAVPFLAMLRRPLLVPVVLGGLSLALDLSLPPGLSGGPLESALPVRFWAFAPGMVLAAIAWRPGRLALAAGIACMCVGAATNEWWGGQWTNLASAAGAALVLASALALRVPWPRAWAAGAAISYGLYLWHVDLIVALGPPGLAVAFVVAAASYILVERPAMWLARDSAVLRRRVGLVVRPG
jgi:peptidoglycan/LPS O-acetylase OafA/YrhL